MPEGSSIANEYWDLGLPVGVPEIAGKYYQLVQLYPYADETPAKLSQMIGMSRENTNRQLRDWEKRGWVRLANRAVMVLDGRALSRIAQDSDFGSTPLG